MQKTAYEKRISDWSTDVCSSDLKPLAQMRKDLGHEFCRNVSDKNPVVAGPLKRTDCSLVSDCAAALVLCDVESALGLNKSVVFRAAQQVNDFLPLSKRDITLFEGREQAWNQVLETAGAPLGHHSLLPSATRRHVVACVSTCGFRWSPYTIKT